MYQGRKTLQTSNNSNPAPSIMEQLAVERCDHLLQIDEKSRELRIYRVDEAGGKTLFTSTLLPTSKGWGEDLEKFAKQLGENVLMDSPAARRLLQL